ncbi:hypothetical protein [Nocardia gamkensis]|uniref:hypothetical protein n=1 Tax=Nocardia gamkensis TaxID=352869 RepID=UPI0037C795A7
MNESLVLPSWRSGDMKRVTSSLRTDSTFSSPVADYHGRADVAHMLGLIATVLEGVEQTGRWGGERDRLFAFTARVDGHELQGILREEFATAGGLEHVTLLLRPYRVLRTAIAKMAQQLKVSPLTGQSA